MPNAATIPLVYVAAFVAVVVLAQTGAGALLSTRDRNQKINRRLTLLESGLNPDEVFAALVRTSATPTLAGGALRRLHDRVDTYCRQADVRMSPLRLLTVTVGLAGAGWLLGLTVMGSKGQGLILNGAVSLVGAFGVATVGVALWVTFKRNGRLKKIEEQLPLALDVVNRAIRAGHPVVSAVQLAAGEMGDPLGSEFGLIVDETTYGAEFKDALLNFARRTGSPDAHYFAVCVGIQSETGGNLAEILEGLASLIRSRNTLSKRVKALASEGKASAYLLSAIPPALASFEVMINPTIYTSKFSDPIFWPSVAFAGVIYMIGWVIIFRIINFKY